MQGVARTFANETADVLVVDDDQQNLVAIEAILQGLGLRVVTATSGEEALRVLLDRDFAVLLLDVKMPSMDGFQVARIIRTRKRSRYVPIIFVTAFSQDEVDMRRGYELGAVDYLFKPILAEALRGKVQFFVELRDRRHQAARQAEQLRALEHIEGERRLTEERRRWEAEQLRREVEVQRRVNASLEEADRRKDDFIAFLAHELRNPLVPIVATLELWNQTRLDDPRLAKARSTMARQVRHVTRLLDDMLDISRITRGKVGLERRVMPVSEIVERALELSAEALAGHDLVVSAAQDAATVEADPERMAQVVSNLLHNAARYTPSGGRIELTTEAVADDVLITVKDDGSGIDAQLLPHIFERFVQGGRGGRGLGLGLTVVKELVQMHGGHVSCQSEGVGKGSTFRVRLPRAETNRAPRGHDERGDGSEATSPLCIVLVEDDDDVRDATNLLLSSWGHTIIEARTAAEGISAITGEHPDVALVDIGLPDADGHSVAREIVEVLGEERPLLVALSGYGQAADRERSSQAGFDRHLVKPASADQLREVLDAAAATDPPPDDHTRRRSRAA